MSGYNAKAPTQAMIVEIYLPKNYTNNMALLGLIQEVMEFKAARQWLIANVKRIRQEVEFWRDAYADDADFKAYLRRMRKPLYGYSIYEMDGGYQSANKNRGNKILVPVRRFVKSLKNTIIKNQRTHLASEALVNALKLEKGAQAWFEKTGDNLYSVTNGTKRYELENIDSTLLVWEKIERPIWVMEERTSVVRFIVDLELPGHGQSTALSETTARPKYSAHLNNTSQIYFRTGRIRTELLQIFKKAGITGLSDKAYLVRNGRTRNYRVSSTRGGTYLYMISPKDDVVLVYTIEEYNAKSRMSDALTLLGQYFVYHLGSRVGIEETILMTYSFDYLWSWERQH